MSTSDDNRSSSAASALASWCRGTRAVLCTYDGAEEEKRRVDRAKSANERETGNEDKMIRSAIRVAAREAIDAAVSGAARIAVLPAGEEMGGAAGRSSDKNKGGLLQGLFGGSTVTIPETMAEAMEGAMTVVRYGELFGAPESSVSVNDVSCPAVSASKNDLPLIEASSFLSLTRQVSTAIWIFHSRSHLLSSEVLAANP